MGRAPDPVRRRKQPAQTVDPTASGESRPHPSQVNASRTPWACASLTLRAAADLVATHYGADGHPRTPDAVRATTADFDAGLADLGHLARAVFAQEEPLALRAIQAGVPRGVVTRQLPGLEPLAELARELSTSGPRSSKANLDLLGQARSPSRADDPAAELADRMVRLRQATWALAGDGTDELASLRTIAGLGVAVHAHAAAFYGADLLAQEFGPPDTGPGALVRHARTWQHLHRALSEFAVLAPPSASIRADAVAAGALLGKLCPIGRRADAHRPSQAERRVGAALNGAVQVMADIAVHEGATFDRLSRAGLLWIPARALPRDAVTDHPDLVASRLAGRLAKPPGDVTRAVARLYAEVAAHPQGSRSAPIGRATAVASPAPAATMIPQ